MNQKFSFEDVNIGKLNFSDICRFCLSNKGILVPIFESRENSRLHELPAQIKTVISVEMEEEDGLPSLICHSCLFNLEQSIDFKKQCEKADSILRNYIQEKNSKEHSTTLPDESETNSDEVDNVQSNEVEASTNEMVDSACQAEMHQGNEEVSVEPVEPFVSNLPAIGSDSKNNIDCEENVGDQVETNENQTESEVIQAPETVLQMEEEMNDVEESMYGSEPFSLDLCSVRLQSEGQDPESMVLYPTPQFTDEDQWSDTGSDVSDEYDSVEPTPPPLQIGSCNCLTCNKAFTNMTDLMRHQLIHKQEPPFPCDYCDGEFEEKTLLKAHWRAHAINKPHMCLTCGEAYMERADLVKHFAVHDLIKPYHCPGCGKAFAYRSDLRKHAVIHTGARPFKCPVCSKTFTRSTNLNKHARVHSNRRPYPCEHCDKMFSSRGDLVRHTVIHTGEKPYACLICSLAFNRKDKLSRHERVHMTDRPFVCSECPTSFHRKEELTKHIRFHHYKPDPAYFHLTNVF